MVDLKDLLLQAGVAVTLILGLVNLYFTLKAGKRTTRMHGLKKRSGGFVDFLKSAEHSD